MTLFLLRCFLLHYKTHKIFCVFTLGVTLLQIEYASKLRKLASTFTSKAVKNDVYDAN